MMPTLRQRAANAITAMHAASTMFAMHAMLGRLAAQLKMPRPDAYNGGACDAFASVFACELVGNLRSAGFQHGCLDVTGSFMVREPDYPVQPSLATVG